MARSTPSRVRTGGLEAHQALGQDAIGADFNSLTHMISTDLLVSVYRISPPFARAQRSFVQRYGCSKNPKKEEAAAVASVVKALNKVQAQLAAFRVK